MADENENLGAPTPKEDVQPSVGEQLAGVVSRRVDALEKVVADSSENTNGALLALEGRIHDLEIAHSTPAAPPTGSAADPNRSATEGEVVWYTGDESGGTNEHVAVVTRVIDADTINATVLFDGSAPAARKGLKRSEKQWAFEPAAKE